MALTAGIFLAAPSSAGDVQLSTTIFAQFSGIKPLFMTNAPGDPSRFFVVGQEGEIAIIHNGVILEDYFIDIGDLLSIMGVGQGLLCATFDPQYQDNGYFYVIYTRQSDDAAVLARYQVTSNPNIADPESGQVMLVVQQDTLIHNGNWIGFGPLDNYMYVSLGDGGGGWDPGDDAQNLDSLLGKILRLDTKGDDFPKDPMRNYAIPSDNPFVGIDGADEVWAYGLRNPWRCSFDTQNGDFYFGDVGRQAWEELNFQPASSAGGENYGWDCLEANECTEQTTCDCIDESLIHPMFAYENPAFNYAAVIGGYVYHGCAIPQLDGAYIFADHFNEIWKLRHVDGNVTDLVDIKAQLNIPVGSGPVSFAQDPLGEIYIIHQGLKRIYKIVDAQGIGDDCNGNFIADACDIASGYSSDEDENSIPDECELIGDLNGDLSVGTADLIILFSNWGPCFICLACPADLDGDCQVLISDLLILFSNWT